MPYQEKFNYPKVKREYTGQSGRVYYFDYNGKIYDGVLNRK